MRNILPPPLPYCLGAVCMGEVFWPWVFQILGFFQNFSFQYSSIFFLCSRTPKNFWRLKFQIFWEKMSEVALLGCSKYQKEQSHEMLVLLIRRTDSWFNGSKRPPMWNRIKIYDFFLFFILKKCYYIKFFWHSKS